MLLSSAVTWAIRPLMLRHALAKPNARSSHRIPTPQGAGIAVNRSNADRSPSPSWRSPAHRP